MAKVRDSHGRVVFDGPDADAEKYLTEHYPWNHADSGQTYTDEDPAPDATIEYGETKSKTSKAKEV